MSGTLLTFDPHIQQPLDAGWLRAEEAWDLELDALMNPDIVTEELSSAWQRVNLFFSQCGMVH